MKTLQNRFVKASQVIFIFVDKPSGHFSGVTVPKKFECLPENPSHPFTWRKVFYSQDQTIFLHEIPDRLTELKLQQLLPPASLSELTLKSSVPKTVFKELEDLLKDYSLETSNESLFEENERNMTHLEDLMQITNDDPFIFNLEDICLTCFQTRDQGVTVIKCLVSAVSVCDVPTLGSTTRDISKRYDVFL